MPLWRGPSRNRSKAATIDRVQLLNMPSLRWPMGYYSHKTVRVVCARDAASVYVWRNGALEFYYCKTCGCVTHHERARKRSNNAVAVNARMMEPEAIASVRIRKLDGASTWKYLDE